MILCASPGDQYQAHKREIDEAVKRVLEKGWYVLGDEVTAFEKEFAAFVGTDYAVSVGSGTDALLLALRALDIGAGDEVITVSHTAVATVAAIELAGAKPVLVDIELGYFTINPSEVEKAITSRTKAIIAVHIYGQPANLDVLVPLAEKHSLRLIEDCAQATGSRWDGKSVGSFGDIGCFSFYPTKNLGAIGDGGAVTTQDVGLFKRVQQLRQYGWEERYISKEAGLNSRLDELQAAVLRVKLPHLNADNGKRVSLAKLYDEGLAGSKCKCPVVREKAEHVFHLYVIRSAHRNVLQAHLAKVGIHTMIHYPVPIHEQPAYRDKIAICGSLSETTAVAKEILSLPLYPELDSQSVKKVIGSIKEVI